LGDREWMNMRAVLWAAVPMLGICSCTAVPAGHVKPKMIEPKEYFSKSIEVASTVQHPNGSVYRVTFDIELWKTEEDNLLNVVESKASVLLAISRFVRENPTRGVGDMVVGVSHRAGKDGFGTYPLLLSEIARVDKVK
jgi:hypothetical protein